mmetsp:Transcript_14213/g.41370  ORF Transcript_14213/g.41370 Transcript_14213/m.41370 type:complete len:326 (-) Transcript_14213:1961-2938(-)
MCRTASLRYRWRSNWTRWGRQYARARSATSGSATRRLGASCALLLHRMLLLHPHARAAPPQHRLKQRHRRRFREWLRCKTRSASPAARLSLAGSPRCVPRKAFLCWLTARWPWGCSRANTLVQAAARQARGSTCTAGGTPRRSRGTARGPRYARRYGATAVSPRARGCRRWSLRYGSWCTGRSSPRPSRARPMRSSSKRCWPQLRRHRCQMTCCVPSTRCTQSCPTQCRNCTAQACSVSTSAAVHCQGTRWARLARCTQNCPTQCRNCTARAPALMAAIRGCAACGRRVYISACSVAPQWSFHPAFQNNRACYREASFLRVRKPA